VNVAGQIDVIDACPLQYRRLLRADVGRQQQQPVACVRGRQRCAEPIQLLDNDSGVLEAKIAPCLDEVPNRPAVGPPRQEAVKADSVPLARRDLGADGGPGHPTLECLAVRLHVRRGPLSHVRNDSKFIKNEQIKAVVDEYLGGRAWLPTNNFFLARPKTLIKKINLTISNKQNNDQQASSQITLEIK